MHTSVKNSLLLTITREVWIVQTDQCVYLHVIMIKTKIRKTKNKTKQNKKPNQNKTKQNKTKQNKKEEKKKT